MGKHKSSSRKLKDDAAKRPHSAGKQERGEKSSKKSSSRSSDVSKEKAPAADIDDIFAAVTRKPSLPQQERQPEKDSRKGRKSESRSERRGAVSGKRKAKDVERASRRKEALDNVDGFFDSRGDGTGPVLPQQDDHETGPGEDLTRGGKGKRFSGREFRPPKRAKRKHTEEGFAVYTEEELGIGLGGDTPLCPFDCDCCF